MSLQVDRTHENRGVLSAHPLDALPQRERDRGLDEARLPLVAGVLITHASTLTIFVFDVSSMWPDREER